MKNLLKRLIPKVGDNNQQSRDAWLQTVLSALPQGLRVLDAGAGTQRNRKFCEHLDYVSQDFAQYDGGGDEVGLQMGAFEYGVLDIVSDITSIPEDDGSFGVVLCTEVLEHLPRPEYAIKEFSRLVGPGGWLVLTAPFCSLTHFSPYHYCSGFNRYWYEYILPLYGFEVLEVCSNGNYFDYIGQELKRVPDVGVRYGATNTSLVTKFCIWFLLKYLARLSAKGSASAELLCYGYHVLAKKS